MKKILVLTDHMPWGHRSIARAIFQGLESSLSKKYQIYYDEVFAQTGFVGNLYTKIYNLLPGAHKIITELAEFEFLRARAMEYTKINEPKLLECLEKIKPDLVISCYFVHSHCLQSIREKYDFKYKLWSVIADPWHIHSLSVVKNADLNLCYDEVICKECDGMAKMLATGWWTRQSIFTKFSKSQISIFRKNMGLQEKTPTIFVGGGSLGTSSINMLLPVLLTINKPLQVIFNTGKDKTTLVLINRFAKLVAKMPLLRKNLKILCYGWIDNLTEILSVCDVVMGKAGPNFLFDVVAAGKPFVSITHIGGQEDENLDLILKKKLGWIAENPIAMAKFINDFLKRPEYYKNVYKDNIMRVAKENKDSVKKIAKLIEKL